MATYQSKHTGAGIDAGIDTANAALPKSGGTMTGALILHADPTNNKGAATKQYVDNAVSTIEITPGADGQDGVDGTTFTPSVSSDGDLSWSNNGGLENPATVNIKGQKGDTGSNGADGVSPTVSISDITGGHRVTITDANGTQSFDVMDGADGSGGDGSGDMLKSIYDSDNDGVVDDAAKLGGKTPEEYASANHAHSEYLTDYIETDPTVPDWAKAENKPEYTATEVGAAATEHTHDVFAVGAAGFVPAPSSDDSIKFLRGDGSWATVASGSNRIFYGTETERDAFSAEEGDIWFVV